MEASLKDLEIADFIDEHDSGFNPSSYGSIIKSAIPFAIASAQDAVSILLLMEASLKV